MKGSLVAPVAAGARRRRPRRCVRRVKRRGGSHGKRDKLPRFEQHGAFSSRWGDGAEFGERTPPFEALRAAIFGTRSFVDHKTTKETSTRSRILPGSALLMGLGRKPFLFFPFFKIRRWSLLPSSCRKVILELTARMPFRTFSLFFFSDLKLGDGGCCRKVTVALTVVFK